MKERGPDKVWCRMDLNSRTYRTTLKHGPKWGAVRARVTTDMATGECLEVEAAHCITRNLEHKLIPGGPRDIITALVYDDVN